MSKAVARKAIWAAAISAVLAILIVFVGLPFFASTQIVRDRIAHQMTAWSGYRVSIDEAPQIHVWPSFRAVLKDVRLQNWDETDALPVLEAEEIEIDLSALAALRGEVVFTRMRLVRPTVRVTNNFSISELPTPASWGRLARSIETAKTAIASSPEQPDLSALPSDALGEIQFVDARIISAEEQNPQDIVTSLTGTLDWPALNRQASLNARGIWKGESVAVQANSAQPLVLLGGGNAPLSIALDASPAKLSFQGTANLDGRGLVDGSVEMSAPSINRLAEWTRGKRLPGGRIGPFTINAHLTGNADRLKLDSSNIAVDTSSGRGMLEVGFETARPSLTGTLAFDTLNLKALASALGPLDLNGGATQVGMPTMSSFDFDLRISAATASFGAVTLSKVAAAAKASDHLSSFDISDAMGFGGNFQIGLRADRTGGQELVELRLNGTEIELGRLAQSFGRENLVPQGKANFFVFLKGRGSNLNHLLSSADGEVSATFGAGRLPGINLENLRTEAAKGDFVPLIESPEASAALDSLEIKATVRNGLAQIDTAQAKAGPYNLIFDGLVPIAGRALALSAILSDSSEPPEELHFFVGGSWDAPFITAPIRVVPQTLDQ